MLEEIPTQIGKTWIAVFHTWLSILLLIIIVCQGLQDNCKSYARTSDDWRKIWGRSHRQKLKQYQKLYENFIAHKEELSHLLGSASPGRQGKALYLPFFVYRLFLHMVYSCGPFAGRQFYVVWKTWLLACVERSRLLGRRPYFFFLYLSLHPKPDITLVQLLHTLEILH